MEEQSKEKKVDEKLPEVQKDKKEEKILRDEIVASIVEEHKNHQYIAYVFTISENTKFYKRNDYV